MSDEDKRPLVNLEDTKASTTDEEGKPRALMEALGKGGEKPPDETVEQLVARPATDEK
jgi:hypothetical protein